jgi:hypothetical protein
MSQDAPSEPVDRQIAAELADAFRRGGYVRRQNSELAREVGWDRYKKGDEVRFIVHDEDELERVRRLLVDAGLKPGKPYPQARGWRQPVYGRRRVAAFLEMIAAVESGD